MERRHPAVTQRGPNTSRTTQRIQGRRDVSGASGARSGGDSKNGLRGQSWLCGNRIRGQNRLRLTTTTSSTSRPSYFMRMSGRCALRAT